MMTCKGTFNMNNFKGNAIIFWSNTYSIYSCFSFLSAHIKSLFKAEIFVLHLFGYISWDQYTIDSLEMLLRNFVTCKVVNVRSKSILEGKVLHLQCFPKALAAPNLNFFFWRAYSAPNLGNSDHVLSCGDFFFLSCCHFWFYFGSS